MEMTPEYAAETAQIAARNGYTLEIEQHREPATGDVVYRATRYRLSAAHQSWTLEVIAYADDEVRYYLEIEHFDLRSRSFPLDSWKHRDTHIEFRYDARPETGLALTFDLRFPTHGGSTPPSRS